MPYKLAFLVLSTLGVGLPFSTPWHYGYAFLIAFFLVFGQSRPALQLKWIFLGLGLLGSAHLIPQLNIIEKQRLLIDNQAVISPQDFIKNNASYPFAQTADGFLQRLGRSRLAYDIKLTNDLRDLRSGYVNKPQFNFYESHLVREDLPFVVCYKITPHLLQRGVTGKGLFYYNNQFVTHPHPTSISFEPDMLGTYFYAFGADRRFAETEKNPYLSLNLNKTWKDYLRATFQTLLKLLGILILAYGFLVLSLRALDWREILLLSVWTGLFLFQYKDIIGRGILAGAGADGIIHGGYPYIMLENLALGDWLKALEASEPIFYFMPGMRYIRFIEMLIFGDSYTFQLTLLFFTPVIYYRLFKALLTAKASLILSSLMFVKALSFIGLSYKLYLVRFLKLYGENVSYACLIGALVLLIKEISSRWQGFWAFFLLAVAASIRPNLLVFIACLAIAHFFLPVFSNALKKDKFIHLLGLSPLSLIPLHNIVFGKKVVLLTTASQIPENLPLPPHFYVEGVQCLLGITSSCSVKEAFINHFMGYGSLVILFMFTNFILFLRQREWNKIKTLTAATFCGLSIHLFYLADNRYLHPYFTISVVMFIVLVKNYRVSLKKDDISIC